MTCSMLNYFFSLSSYLQHTLFYDMFDAQLFLQSQLVPSTHFVLSHAQLFLQSQLVPSTHFVLSHVRWSTISSVSARTFNTLCFITCSMLNHFLSLSSYLQHTVLSHAGCSDADWVSALNLEWTRVSIILSLTQSLKFTKNFTHRTIICRSRRR